MRPPLRPTLPLILALALLGSGSCQRIRPVRTLPNWVRGIYVPMVQNKTTEPGLEEVVTREIQHQFLADGRVRVVQKQQADLQLVAIIKSYTIMTDDVDSDDIARRHRINVTSDVFLYDPGVDPFDPKEEPIAKLNPIATRYVVNADPRSVNFIVEPDMREGAMAALARQVVNQTITGFPAELKGLQAGTKLPVIREPDQGIQGDIFRNKRSPVD